MYRETRHGIVEPVKIKPILHRVLVAVGVLLIITTGVLVVLRERVLQAFPANSLTDVCNFNVPVDLPPSQWPQCGPTPAQLALPSEYAHRALASGLVAVCCLVGAYVLRPRQPRH